VGVDPIRLGLGFRALRRRRGWSQARLAAAARVSRSVIWRIERGHADRVTLSTIHDVASALEARVDLRLLWHGDGLDRLVDAGHARLVELAIALLDRAGWLVATEVSFNVRGERGSIDILGFHPTTTSLLVVEVKSVVPDLQAMLHAIDRKGRLARSIARERGWSAMSVTRLLVLPEDRTARRRLTTHSATFGVALPARNVAIRRWVLTPVGTMDGSCSCQMHPTGANASRRSGRPWESSVDEPRRAPRFRSCAPAGRHLSEIV
jgi:transcriptional regulator with XRE-family HTH domain